MPQITNEDEARRRLINLTQAECSPVLEDDEIEDLVEDCKVASIWAASTAYELGDRVVPTSLKKTGCVYKAVRFDGEGVSSGTTEPNWTDGRGATFSDNNITWEECGYEPKSLWDLNKGAEMGWLLKAGKVAPQHDYGTADLKMSAGQMYQHCLDQANRYRPVEVA